MNNFMSPCVCKGFQVRNTLRPKIGIFDLEGLSQPSGIASVYLKLAVLATADICDLSRQTVIAIRQIIGF